jgi:aryl-alcohol dehydrogenase-like predicted oxidoreductase
MSTTRETPLGPTGFDITRVGLGAWAIGGPWEKGWGEQDDAESVATIMYAIESGISWIDTAAVYGLGHAETVIGGALATLPEDERPTVLTKCGRFEGHELGSGKVGNPKAIRQGCEESLQRLRVDVLDCLQLHWPPDDVPVELTWQTMAELKEEGKCASIGASNCSVEQLTAMHQIAPVEVVQPPLSLINRAVLGDVVPWALEHGVGVLVYSPMQSGLLTGSYHQRAELAADDWRRESPEYMPPKIERNLYLVERLRPIADELGASVSELAIAWVLTRAGVTAAIVGARRPGQVDGWIGAADLELDDAALAAIAAAVAESDAGQGPLGTAAPRDHGDLVGG